MNDYQADPDSVRCHSGYTYAQRPVGFTFDGQDYEVEKIVAESRLPEGRQFLIQTSDMKFFDLIYNQVEDQWQVQISERAS